MPMHISTQSPHMNNVAWEPSISEQTIFNTIPTIVSALAVIGGGHRSWAMADFGLR